MCKLLLRIHNVEDVASTTANDSHMPCARQGKAQARSVQVTSEPSAIVPVEQKQETAVDVQSFSVHGALACLRGLAVLLWFHMFIMFMNIGQGPLEPLRCIWRTWEEIQHRVSNRKDNLHPNEPRVIYPSVYVSDVPVEWNEAGSGGRLFSQQDGQCEFFVHTCNRLAGSYSEAT